MPRFASRIGIEGVNDGNQEGIKWLWGCRF